MEEKDIKSLLDLYLKGKCTPDEKQELEAWFDQLSAEGAFEPEAFDKVALMQRLKGKIDTQIRRERSIKLPAMLKIAAAVILVASVTLGYYKGRLRNWMTPVHYATTIAPKGQRIKLTLSDGSTVILNAGSRIRYPEAFNRETRAITLLDGEAFFEVQQDEEKPFVVATPGTQTQVLGTAFNVQAYAAFEEVKITVTHGKVAVKATGPGEQKPVLLLPDEQVIVNTVTGRQVKQHINASESTGWMRGKFQFRNETLVNVALILQHNYDVRIIFKKEATKGIRFTANFNSTDSLEKVLFAIAKANGLTYSMKDKIVQF